MQSPSKPKSANKTKIKYQRRLEASIKSLRWLIHQGIPCRGHDEKQESLNMGNFIELLKFYAEGRLNVEDFVLDISPNNCQMTSPSIQKDIINACAKETTKAFVTGANMIYANNYVYYK